MSRFDLTCPKCQDRLAADSSSDGKTICCPNCETEIALTPETLSGTPTQPPDVQSSSTAQGETLSGAPTATGSEAHSPNPSTLDGGVTHSGDSVVDRAPTAESFDRGRTFSGEKTGTGSEADGPMPSTFDRATANGRDSVIEMSSVSHRRTETGIGLVTDSEVTLEWNVGDVILDLYKVKQIHRSGGMGVVYRVHHLQWKTDLAVKTPKLEQFQSETQKQNFRNEAEAWVHLGLHPHTVSCYYVRDLGGVPRVFAEYVDGGNLFWWIHGNRDGQGKLYEGGPVEALRRILDIAIQTAWGLQHAHAHDLIHQDVKPGNVLMSLEGVAKVTDFGMAKARGVIETRNALTDRSLLATFGGMTPVYCSPEQAKAYRYRQPGRQRSGPPPLISRRSDIWSWAVMILEMFTAEILWGRGRPFPGEFAGEWLRDKYRSLQFEPDIPRIPDALLELLDRCLQTEVVQRPHDMIDVVGALMQIFENTTGEPYPRSQPHAVELTSDSLNNQAVSLLDLRTRENANALISQANRLWDQARELTPQHPESVFNKGLIQWRNGHISADELIVQLSHTSHSDIENARSRYLIAEVKRERDDPAATISIRKRLEHTVDQRQHDRKSRQRSQTGVRGPKDLVHTPKASEIGLEIHSVSLSSDGRVVVIGSEKCIWVWKEHEGEYQQALAIPVSSLSCVALSGNGQVILSIEQDGTSKLWSVRSGQPTPLTSVGFGAKSAGLSHDGRLVLLADGFSLKTWDVSRPDAQPEFQQQIVSMNSVSLSRNGQLALIGRSDGQVWLWDVSRGRRLQVFSSHQREVTSISLSGSGSIGLSASVDDFIRVCDIATGEQKCILRGHDGFVSSVAVSSDGRFALSGGHDATVRLWDLENCRCLTTSRVHDRVVAVSLSDDSRTAVWATADGRVTLAAVETGKPEHFLAPYRLCRARSSEDSIKSAQVYQRELELSQRQLQNRNYVAAHRHLLRARSLPGYSRRKQAVTLWQELYRYLPQTGFQGGWNELTFEETNCGVSSLSLSAYGTVAVSGHHDKQIRLWEVKTGQCLRVFEDRTWDIPEVSLSPDVRFVASSGGFDGTWELWDAATGVCERDFEGHSDKVTSVFLSRNGRWALTGSSDKSMRLWDIRSGRCLQVFAEHPVAVAAVWLGMDNRSALSGSDRILRVWDVATGRILREFHGHQSSVCSVAMSCDNRYAVSGSRDKTVRLWEVNTGRCLCVFSGHTDQVSSVRLSVNGRWLLSGSWDATVRLWDAATGDCLRCFEGHDEGVTSVEFANDGRFALSGGRDGTIRKWKLDWRLDAKSPADWDEGARPYLATFLKAHAPLQVIRRDQRRTLHEKAIGCLRSLFGRSWKDRDFQVLQRTLSDAGYGWLRPEGVKRKLIEMAADWTGRPPLGE